ncbi:MAG: hypothetical protein ACFFBV_16000 [Promethearchaeota archaeon]
MNSLIMGVDDQEWKGDDTHMRPISPRGDRVKKGEAGKTVEMVLAKTAKMNDELFTKSKKISFTVFKDYGLIFPQINLFKSKEIPLGNR